MHSPTWIPVRVAASIAIAASVVVAIAACGSGGGSAGPSASASDHSAAAPASASPSGTPDSPPGAAGCDTVPWQSGPVTMTHHVTVPPTPVITAVRVAQHPECGYDRVVLDVSGPIPGYTVKYVQQVVADASGQVITMPGARFLQITLRPAQAHTAVGTPTVASGVRQSRFPALASWALAGDVEGTVTIALGVAGQASVRTGELPGRIYIDVKE